MADEGENEMSEKAKNAALDAWRAKMDLPTAWVMPRELAALEYAIAVYTKAIDYERAELLAALKAAAIALVNAEKVFADWGLLKSRDYVANASYAAREAIAKAEGGQ